MLEFCYDCVDKYLSRQDFEYSEMDTHSAYKAISGNSFEALIKPDLSEEFENDKHNWFVTPRAPQVKRTHGLFKVEFEGDKIISLCSKTYCIEKFALESYPGQVKFSMKGVNKGQFKNPMPHYQHVLHTSENFHACNSVSELKTKRTFRFFFWGGGVASRVPWAWRDSYRKTGNFGRVGTKVCLKCTEKLG